MKVKVEKKHIRKGKKGYPDRCPIALALKDTLGADDVKVWIHCAEVNGTFFQLPHTAQLFIQDFDKKKSSVKPFEFEL